MNAAIRDFLPTKDGMLKRPRIEKLLKEGIRHSLLRITAAPGYGKTQETALFLRDAHVRLAWLHMSDLDNLPDHFWANFTTSIRREFPVMAGKLEQAGFPNTLVQIDKCLRILVEEIYAGPPVVFVFDDFDVLENIEVLRLLEILLETNMENTCLALISRAPGITTPGLRWGGNEFHIEGDALRFTVDETRDLFRQNNIALTSQALRMIDEDTEGWPLMLFLLSKQYETHMYEKSRASSLAYIYQLFQKEYFDGYDENIRSLLVKLSLFAHFSLRFIYEIFEGDSTAIQLLLQRNIFIVCDNGRNRYALHHHYREYLRQMQYGISGEEHRRIFKRAGAMAVEEGHTMQAIEYFWEAQCYDDLLSASIKCISDYYVLTQAQSSNILNKLRLMPEAYQVCFEANYIKASLYLQSLRLAEAMDILKGMEEKLLVENTDFSRRRLGEVYERMAGIYMLQCDRQGLLHYKKAAALLPNGSAYQSPDLLIFNNFSVFGMDGYGPGALKQMEESMYENISYMVQVKNGSAAGFQYLYSTEAAYLTCDFSRAEKMAHHAILDAKPARQHDIVCNAYYMLAKVAYMRGDYEALVDAITKAGQYADTVRNTGIQEMQAYIWSWFHFKLGETSDIAAWLSTAEEGVATMLPLAIGREELLYAEYLLQKAKYSEMIALLERIRWYMVRSWGDRVSACLLLCLAHFKRDEKEKALDYLKEVYDMTKDNAIIAPYVEVGEMMRSILEYAQRTQPTMWDAEWVNAIRQKIAEFTKGLERVKIAYRRAFSNTAASPQIKLSRREKEILQYLSKGYTREEIAESLYITVNTVKSTISNLYNKLGAINRADAIRIAVSAGLL